MRTFSSTVNSGKMLVIWNVREIPRRQRRLEGSAEMSSPLHTTWPVLGRITPEIRWKKLVFPAPFGPMMARSSPGSTATLTRSTARSAPNERESARVSRIGGMSPRVSGRSASSLDEGLHSADHSAWHEDDDQDEDGAGEDHPLLGVARHDLLDQQEHHRAKHGPDQCADPADDHHHQRLAREHPEHDLGRSEASERRKKGAGEAGEEGRNHEDDKFEPARVLAKHRKLPLVLADGL